MIMIPQMALAASNSGMSREYHPPSDSDYYQKKMSYQLFFDFGTVKVRMTQYKPGLPMEEKNIQTIVTWKVKENSFMWMDQKCGGALNFDYLDASGKIVSSHLRGETTTYLNQGSCTNPVSPSDFNEEKNQYKGDTFGGKKDKLKKPESSDGSGGTSETGYKGVDDGKDDGKDEGETGSGGDTGGGDTGGGEEDSCDSCAVLDCPKWDEHMKKINEIAAKIPPVPDWDKVAKTFRDTIAPQVKKDLEDTIGKAPSPPATPSPPAVNKPNKPSAPSAPSQPGDLDDRGIKAPTGNEAPGLDDSTFTEDDIKDESTKIKEREDSSGGFKINDPINALPSQDEFMENLPSPETGQSKNPAEQDLPSPSAPEEQENAAPRPVERDNSAPTPGGTGATAPIPGDSNNSAPIPNEGATAPIPDRTNETAPIPGGG